MGSNGNRCHQRDEFATASVFALLPERISPSLLPQSRYSSVEARAVMDWCSVSSAARTPSG